MGSVFGGKVEKMRAAGFGLNEWKAGWLLDENGVKWSFPARYPSDIVSV